MSVETQSATLDHYHKAGGTFNHDTKEWEWEPVQWQKRGSLYYSNREIPDEFWTESSWTINRRKPRKVAGCILLRPNKDDSYDILVVQCYHNKFGFPKGKCNENESFLDAAMREFEEEIGTTVSLNKSNLTIKRNERHKHVTFYIQIVPSDYEIKTFPIANVEITAFGWVNQRDIHRLDLTDLTRHILRDLNKLLMRSSQLKKLVYKDIKNERSTRLF